MFMLCCFAVLMANKYSVRLSCGLLPRTIISVRNIEV